VWLDWGKQVTYADFFRFTQQLIAFRNVHPAICRSRFWRDDVKWYGPNGDEDQSTDSHTLSYVIHGSSVGDTDIYVMVNTYWEDVNFTLQEPGPWTKMIDTNQASPNDIGIPVALAGPAVVVAARSVVVAVKGA
jgi:glycogen operon protein